MDNGILRRGRGEGEGRSSLPFLKIKKCPDFLNEGPDCVHHWVKFSIQNVEYLGEKTSKCFPAGPLFLVFLTKSLLKCSSSTNLGLPIPHSLP